MEANKSYITLNNGDWIIDRKSGVAKLSQGNNISSDLEGLICK